MEMEEGVRYKDSYRESIGNFVLLKIFFDFFRMNFSLFFLDQLKLWVLNNYRIIKIIVIVLDVFLES